MRFTQTTLSEDLTILNLVEGSASATLELHRGYYSYYWPSRLAPNDFFRHIVRNLEPKFTSIVYDDDLEGIQTVRGHRDLSKPFLGNMERRFSKSVSLIRINGFGRSWVWQCAPDGRLESDQADELSNAFIRNGLPAYTGCASTEDHMRNFRIASQYLIESAAGGPGVLQYIDLIQRNLNRWVES